MSYLSTAVSIGSLMTKHC